MNNDADDPNRLFLDRDDSGHWYLIDANKRKEWNDWLRLPENDGDSWHPPRFATRICGDPSNVTFLYALDESDPRNKR